MLAPANVPSTIPAATHARRSRNGVKRSLMLSSPGRFGLRHRTFQSRHLLRVSETWLSSSPVTVIQTERLAMRMLRDDDLDALAQMYADAETMRYIGIGEPLDREATWREVAMHLGHWRLRGYGMWALEERATGTLIGRAGLWNPEGWPALEAGWLVARPRWGEGFATEAARAILDHAFAVLGLEHIVSFIHPDNAASIRVAEKMGGRREGTVLLNGRDHLVFGADRASGQT
jgi:RimJ/RimL family protein N-acetyltransferase